MGEIYIIDTSVYSRYMTRRLADEAHRFFEEVIRTESLMSVITRMELLLSWTTNDRQLDVDVRTLVDDSVVLPLSEEVILQAVRLRRQYKSVKLPDAIIAATAMVNDWTLLSTNDNDFTKISGLLYRSLN